MDSLLALRNGTFYDQLNIPLLVTVIVAVFTVLYFFRKVSLFLFPKGLDTESTKHPHGIEKINDSVYEFKYTPADNLMPTVDIIFFHGLQRGGDYKNAFWRTWLSLKGDVLWPQDWLRKNIPGARILSVSYNSCDKVTATTGNIDLYRIGENFVTDLILSEKPGVGRNCPVILVGHSLGGVVIKQLILSALKKKNQLRDQLEMNPKQFRDSLQLDRINKFLTNVCGVFYYATPHGGSKLADRAVRDLSNRSSLLHFLTVLNSDASRLNDEFTKCRTTYKMRTFAVAESHRTQYRGFSALVVPEASTRFDCDGYATLEADHINVCKPEDETSNAYLKLCDFIDGAVPEEVRESILKQVEDERIT